MNAPTLDLLQDCISLYGEKTVDAVLNLPEEELTWVVYNANMISSAVMLIANLRGVEFFGKYVKVISRDSSDGARGKLFFDPNLHNLIGNGYG